MVRATCEEAVDDATTLSVGQRDAHLLAARAAMFGERLDALAACPRCGERLEFSIDAGTLRHASPPGCGGAILIEEGGLRLSVRPPDSRDLAAIATADSLDEARRRLLQRCVLRLDFAGDTDIAQLPPAVLERVSAVLSEHDAQADVTLAMRCVACGHAWQLLFDIGAFLWSEIDACATRLLGEVDALARAYGWREADILAMSGTRRAAYLGMVT
jgi:hypothetical protein